MVATFGGGNTVVCPNCGYEKAHCSHEGEIVANTRTFIMKCPNCGTMKEQIRPMHGADTTSCPFCGDETY